MELSILRTLINEAQEEILEEQLLLERGSKKHAFKAVFILGPAGSGKSFIANNILGIPKEFHTVNPDEKIESIFPKLGISTKFVSSTGGDDPYSRAVSDEEDKQQSARGLMQYGTSSQAADWISTSNPLLFDTTGEGTDRGGSLKVVSQIKSLIALGYDIAMFFVNVPTATSVTRDKERKRTVDEPRTTMISQAFQRNVIANKGFSKAFANVPEVTFLNTEETAFNNIFYLGPEGNPHAETPTDNPWGYVPEKIPDPKKPGHYTSKKVPISYGQTLPGVYSSDTEKLYRDNDDFDTTPEEEEEKLQYAKEVFDDWLPTIENELGRKLFIAMRNLRSLSGGKLGRHIKDILVAAQDAQLASSPVIAAANHLMSTQPDASIAQVQKRMGSDIKKGAKLKSKPPEYQDATLRQRLATGNFPPANTEKPPSPEKTEKEKQVSLQELKQIIKTIYKQM